ncbi:MAG: hypothetical protein OXP71_00305 [Candidatus Poribacteria bacterium]|nr:hypothetical protein [Candidatus Poribacteria bacterium]
MSRNNPWNFYRTGFTIAFDIRSVDSKRPLDPAKCLNLGWVGARCPAYKTPWRTRGKMPRLQDAVTHAGQDAPPTDGGGVIYGIDLCRAQ